MPYMGGVLSRYPVVAGLVMKMYSCHRHRCTYHFGGYVELLCVLYDLQKSPMKSTKETHDVYIIFCEICRAHICRAFLQDIWASFEGYIGLFCGNDRTINPELFLLSTQVSSVDSIGLLCRSYTPHLQVILASFAVTFGLLIMQSSLWSTQERHFCCRLFRGISVVSSGDISEILSLERVLSTLSRHLRDVSTHLFDSLN